MLPRVALARANGAAAKRAAAVARGSSRSWQRFQSTVGHRLTDVDDF